MPLVHYRIERLIGQGGMSKVFLAEDTRLHRKVAFRVPPAEMGSHADRLFWREAQAVTAEPPSHRDILLGRRGGGICDRLPRSH